MTKEEMKDLFDKSQATEYLYRLNAMRKVDDHTECYKVWEFDSLYALCELISKTFDKELYDVFKHIVSRGAKFVDECENDDVIDEYGYKGPTYYKLEFEDYPGFEFIY